MKPGGWRKGTWRFLRDFRYVVPYARRYWGLVLASFGSLLGASLFTVIAPWPLAILVDSVLGHKQLPGLVQPFLGGLGRDALLIATVTAGLVFTAAQHGLGVADNYVNTKLEQKMVLDFRSDVLAHVQKLSLNFHDKMPPGQLLYRLQEQVDSIGEIALATPTLTQAGITVAGMFVVALGIDPQIALISLVVVPVIYYSASYYTRNIAPNLRSAQGKEMEAMSAIYEMMSMLRVVAVFGRESHEHGRYRDLGEQAVTSRVRVTMGQTVFGLVVSTITAAGTALVLGLGAEHVLHHQLRVGELLVLVGYIAAIYQPLEQISTTIATLQLRFVALTSVVDLLDETPEIRDAPGAVAIGRARGELAFEGVSFEYTGRQDTLQDVSFSVPAGTRVAVVGPTGAGKTTITNLLLRFYDPQEGRITLDGHDLREVTLASLRQQISVVLQEPLLFSTTVAQNIRYGRLDATDEDLEQAARSAGAHDFIMELPDGYETQVGERGANVSGGERQRICVARAFLKDAPVLILDEPTSAIDSRTEAVILDALDRLMEGRTSFMIAHRLSTVRQAELILVLNRGQIVQAGSHEELMEHPGLYSHLYDLQTRAPPATSVPAAARVSISDADRRRRERERERAQRDGAPGPAEMLARFGPLLDAMVDLRQGSSAGLQTLAADAGHPDPRRKTLAQLAATLLAEHEQGPGARRAS